MTQARLELDDYTTKVLDVVKGKFGLKNRDEALKRFVLENGSDYVEPQVNEEYLNELDKVMADHLKKHPDRRMTLKELDKIMGLD